jgi:hypothetical protein
MHATNSYKPVLFAVYPAQTEKEQDPFMPQ